MACGYSVDSRISFLLQFKRFANFCYQPIAGSLLRLQITDRFPAENVGKLSAINVNGHSTISSWQLISMDSNTPNVSA
jgi:hypothetical protein